MKYKLTSSQLNFYTKNSDLDNSIWNQSLIQSFPKVYSYEQLNDAYNFLRRDHEGLRVKFMESDDGLVSYVEDYKHINFPFVKVGSHEEMLEEARKFVNTPMDLYGMLVNPIIFQTPTTSGIMISAHHIAIDGFCSYILSEDINKYLQDPEYHATTQPYAEYMTREEKHKQSKRFVSDREFWKKQFSTNPDCNIFADKKASVDFSSDMFNKDIPDGLLAKIKIFCANNEISPSSFFNTVYAEYVHRIFGVENFTIGTPVLNRTTSAEFRSIGLYMHIVPLVINLQPESFIENAKRVEDSWLNIFRHQKFTQYNIRQMLQEEGKPAGALYDMTADFLEFVPNDDYEIIIPYGNILTVPMEIHMQSFKEEKCNLRICYQKSYFNEKEVETMFNAVVALMENALEHPFENIHSLEMLSVDERKKVLCEFNNTTVEYSKEKGVYELFEEQVEKTPDKSAVIFKDFELTYSQLKKKVSECADKLYSLNIKPNDIVAAHLERSCELIVFQLAILKIGAIFLPVDKRYPIDRIKQMCVNCNVNLLITDELNKTAVNANVIHLDEFNTVNATQNATTVKNLDNCYIIYTSGSTGTPKGCMLTGKGLLNFCLNNNTLETLNNIKNPVFACVNSASFDYFIAETLLPLTNGFTVALLDDNESSNQKLFLSAVTRNNINVIMTTPTRLNIYYSDKENCLDLRNISCICTSGEPLTPDLLDKMYKKSANAQVYNPIGPSECSVWDMGGRLEKEDGLDIHIGKPIANAQIYITDKYLNPTPIGVIGEICIAGDGVGSGYLNQPELTNEKFIDNPFGNGKLYKTGDLAYWREDGNICYVGRNDFQVKVRGLRIELGEIENAIIEIDGVFQCATVVRKDNEDRQFICAFYTGEKIDAKDLRSNLLSKLPKYMVPHIFTHLKDMPLTSSGKINRNALPEIDLADILTDVEYIAPSTQEENVLTTAIQETLDVEKVSILDNFFDLGGDSLKSIELTSVLEDYGYTVNINEIYDAKDIRSLATCLVRDSKTAEKVEYDSILPATAAQIPVYTSQTIDGNSTLYNIPYIFEVENLDINKLEIAVNELIARHESLRTSFENRDGQIVQIINDVTTIKIEKLKDANPKTFIRPFNLSVAPLIRVGYYENTVMVDFHHIIADGSAIAIFFKELNELYMNRELPLTTQYGEFAVTTTYTEDDEKYWLNVFDEVPALELFTDFSKSETQSFKGANKYTVLNKILHEKILNKCKQLGITPYAYYLACYNILLSKFSGNEDICVGVPSSGRSSKFINTVGMFVNMLSLRNQPTGVKAFKEFANEIKDNSVKAIQHQNYPQATLIKKMNRKNALYDVMFAYQSEEMTDIVFGDKKATMQPTPLTTAKCDLSFYVMPQENNVVLMAEYCTDLYKEETINKFIDAYNSILEQALNENALIKDISVITEADTSLLKSFNNTTVEYEKDKCIHQLFEEQVERTPEKIALVANDKAVTYKELNEEANRIANNLISQGVGKGDIVGLMLPRKSYLLAALFGILKTGAAYLPIDMELPQERIEYMCKDTNAKLVVSQDNIDALLENNNDSNPNVNISNDSLCYCIYTSGSTGQPKGVMARHRNVVNYISKNEHNIFGKIITDDFENIVSISTCSFDIFVTETIATLVNGLKVVLADEQECRNQYALNRLLTRENGQFLQTTPTKLKALTKEPNQREFLKNVKAILLGGEAMEFSYLNELKTLTNAKIYNIYGVTEVPIWSAFVDTDTFTDAITIGHGIASTQMYVVDKHLNPVPIGVMGELCIAGDSVSSGYLNKPDLTAEKFIDNPFGNGKLYRTGDHAYWREDGNLVFIGRKDFQVKIRGLRIELGEIESAIQTIEEIERAVVVVRKDNEDRQLLCAFYTGTEINPKDFRTILSAKLPKYMVPHIFTHLEKMPMTASGKANRNALPEIDLNNITTETEYVAPTTEKETILTKAIEYVLDIENVSILDNFFDLGGDSLKSIELISKLEDKGYTVNVKSIFDAKSVQELAKLLITKEQEEIKVEYDSILPATAAQMRIYTAQIMSPDSTHYNISYALKATNINKEKLQDAVNKLIVRHESLRTHFETTNGIVNQVIDESATVVVENFSSDLAAFNKPFDLSKSPLLRVGCNEDTIAINIHHIVIDGESMPVFFKELNELYVGRELKDTVQYGAFAVTDTYTEENEKYWLDVFSEKIQTLELPTDYQRPAIQSFNGANIYTRIDDSLNEKVLSKCKELGITPYIYYMACYNILLSKYSGNEDICVSTPVSGRNNKFLNTVGMFVNTIALRNAPIGTITFKDFANKVKENSINAIDNQNYPFNELVKKLNVVTSNRNPLYDIMFAYQSEEMTNIIFNDEIVELIPPTTKSVKSELGFYVLPRKNDIVLSVEYRTDLYKEETINKFIDAYNSILEQALNENALIKDISVLTTEEKNTLSSFNKTEYTYNIPANTTLYSLFEKKSEENKNKV
ncbi:MAG: amino acid adenylation domain-containing protein, partial [Clostridia bacterium]|nr:amino acid adenylation domain-containing protein [Clostridia bacterium]